MSTNLVALACAHRLSVFHALVAKGIVVLPKSVTPARINANYNGAVDAVRKLDAADVETLDGLAANGKQKRSAIPAFCLIALQHVEYKY